MLFRLGAKAQAVDQLQRVAQAVATGKLVADLAEDLADAVFQRVGAAGALAKALQIGEQRAINEGDQIGAGQRLVMVKLTAGSFGRGPGRPAVGFVDNEAIGPAHQLRLLRALVFEIVQVLEKQHPRSLLGVIQLGGATGFFPEHVVDVANGLLKHSASCGYACFPAPGSGQVG
jgi:hypothetical protein